MKRLIIGAFLLIILLTFSGCSKEQILEENKEEIKGNFITVRANDDGKIVIDTIDVTNEVTFVNYEVEGVIIQFVLVRGTDGVVRIAFNTCQACNPSPNAYFIQVGNYLECQNCGNRFHIDKIGIEKGGCNPAPVEEMEETDNQIIIDKAYVDSFKDKFENWGGPTK